MTDWFARAKCTLLKRSARLTRSTGADRRNAYRRAFAFETLEPRLTLSVAPGLTSTPQIYSGALNGKIVFTSPGHGWDWNSSLGRYATDRGDNNEIVEDFGNQDQMTFYADYLLRRRNGRADETGGPPDERGGAG